MDVRRARMSFRCVESFRRLSTKRRQRRWTPAREWYSNLVSNDIFPRTLATLIGSQFNKILAREFSALSLDEIDEKPLYLSCILQHAMLMNLSQFIKSSLEKSSSFVIGNMISAIKGVVWGWCYWIYGSILIPRSLNYSLTFGSNSKAFFIWKLFSAIS